MIFDFFLFIISLFLFHGNHKHIPAALMRPHTHSLYSNTTNWTPHASQQPRTRRLHPFFKASSPLIKPPHSLGWDLSTPCFEPIVILCRHLEAHIAVSLDPNFDFCPLTAFPCPPIFDLEKICSSLSPSTSTFSFPGSMYPMNSIYNVNESCFTPFLSCSTFRFMVAKAVWHKHQCWPVFWARAHV